MSLKNILFEKRAFYLFQDVLKRGFLLLASFLRLIDRINFDDACAHAPMIVNVVTKTVRVMVAVTFIFFLLRPAPRPSWLSLVLVLRFLF